MPKRFTDTDKWKKPFIRNLPTEYKLFWFFLMDDCDYAGIWHVDNEVACLRIGKKIDLQKALQYFEEKIIPFDDGSKWFIKDFVSFQYGELRDNNKAHVSVIRTLTKYGFLESILHGFSTPLNNNIKGEKRLKVFSRDNHTCIYCNEKFAENELEPDHIVPLNLGGRNDLENVVTACKSCNRKKSDLTLDVFIEKFSLNKEEVYKRISYSRGLQSPSLGAKDKEKDKEKELDKEMDKDKDSFEGVETFLNPFTEKFLVSWDGWKKYKLEEHRDRYKSPKTESAAIKKLYELSSGNEDTARQIIENSIANQYKGLFAIKNSNNAKQQPINDNFRSTFTKHFGSGN